MTPAPGSSTTTLGPTTARHGNTSLVPTAMRSYNLDKVTGLNYLTWATQMTLVLKRADLWDIHRKRRITTPGD
jgi:hypothetical protein